VQSSIVDVVDLDISLNQPTDNVGVAPVRGPDQPGAVEGVL
jgi:hypothetical protein